MAATTGKKTQKAPPKSRPNPADVRALGGAGQMIQQTITREWQARFRNVLNNRKKG